MKYKSQAQLAEDARARAALRAVASLAGWSPDPLACIAPTGSRSFLYERPRELVLIPQAGRSQARIEESVRALRCDALIVQGAPDQPDLPFLACLVSWAEGHAQWLGPCRFWLSGQGQLWLATDQGGDCWGPYLDLAQTRLRSAPVAPWSSKSERDAGFGRASAAVARLIGETPA